MSANLMPEIKTRGFWPELIVFLRIEPFFIFSKVFQQIHKQKIRHGGFLSLG